MGQAMDKFKKGESTPEQVDNKLPGDLAQIIDEVYNAELKEKDVGYDDLYHAIFNIIQKLREKNGALQFKLPSKEELNDEFKERSKGGKLTKQQCKEIIGKMITIERFSVGQGAIDILLYLFGIPICALMAKRIIPGMKSISDDVVIPAATSASVIFLAKTNKL
ncbi:uncharacterized protein LOC144573095 [Carex rostrata]